jgi:hypothetical protein
MKGLQVDPFRHFSEFEGLCDGLRETVQDCKTDGLGLFQRRLTYKVGAVERRCTTGDSL